MIDIQKDYRNQHFDNHSIYIYIYYIQISRVSIDIYNI